MRRHARRLASLGAAIAFAAGAAGTAAADSWSPIERIPGQTPLTVQVSGAARIYFRVSPAAPLSLPIEGPTRLRVISRVELPARSDRVVRYAVAVSDGRHELERDSTESSASLQAHDPDPSRWLGKSRKMTVDVPAGAHAVTIRVAGGSALVRLQQSAPADREPPTVSLTPVAATRSVLVSEGEKTIAYYTSLVGSPVRFHVVGPTTLDLLTRLDFDETMRGTQAYRLSVTENGRSLRDMAFKTSKATTAVYTNLRERVPSKFDRTRIAVGPGLHELVVNLVAPARGSVEVHGRIPEPQTGGEE